MKMPRDLLRQRIGKFRISTGLQGMEGRTGMKYKNTKEKAFNSVPGEAGDLENSK